MKRTETRWLVKRGDEQVLGCDNVQSLRSMAEHGIVRHDDQVWNPTTQAWMPAAKVKALAGAFPRPERARAVAVKKAPPSHLRPALALAVIALVLFGALFFWRRDSERIESWVFAGHQVLAEGAVVSRVCDEAYESGGPAAAAAFPKSERGKTSLFSLDLARKGLTRPAILWRGAVHELDAAMRAYVDLFASPRASRSAQAQQVSDARDAFEQALATLEPAVSRTVVGSARARGAARAATLTSALSFAAEISRMNERAAQSEAAARRAAIPTPVAPTRVPTPSPIPTVWAKLPSSFDGLEWGARFPASGFVESRRLKDGTRGFRREGEPLDFGGVPLLDAVYLWRHSVFAGLHLEAAPEKRDALHAAATKAWGPESPQFASRIHKPGWATPDGSFAFLETDPESARARLVIGSKDYW